MKRSKAPLSKQVKKHATRTVKKKGYDGNTETMISTGSTLLDLAISGGRVRGGGIPSGIMVEIFGPNSSGKTVLLCEIAGDIQRKNGEIMFHDPEARLNKQFAQIFDLDTNKMEYSTPDTIPEVFKQIRNWKPDISHINGVVTDSLAALSTDMEMEREEGDKMGGRRPKEFSEQIRKTCRKLPKNNLLLVCSNQIRDTMNTFGPKYKSPGGYAIGFYSSLRLRTEKIEEVKPNKTYKGKDISEVTGIVVKVFVFKSSIWKPGRSAEITIDFDIGIDNIRENLKFIKKFSGEAVYTLGGNKLDNSLIKSIKIIEEGNHEDTLQNEVIELWEEIEKRHTSKRKKKKR